MQSETSNSFSYFIFLVFLYESTEARVISRFWHAETASFREPKCSWLVAPELPKQRTFQKGFHLQLSYQIKRLYHSLCNRISNLRSNKFHCPNNCNSLPSVNSRKCSTSSSSNSEPWSRRRIWRRRRATQRELCSVSLFNRHRSTGLIRWACPRPKSRPMSEPVVAAVATRSPRTPSFGSTRNRACSDPYSSEFQWILFHLQFRLRFDVSLWSCSCFTVHIVV